MGRRAAGLSTLALHDLRLLTRDRPAVFWTILMPVAFMWVFGRAFSGEEGRRPQADLAVVVEDDGFLAKSFLEELRGEGVTLEVVSAGGAAADIASERPRTLRIPAGFTASLLDGEKVELTLERGRGGALRFDQLGEIRVWRAAVRLVTNLVELDRTRDLGGGSGDGPSSAGHHGATGSGNDGTRGGGASLAGHHGTPVSGDDGAPEGGSESAPVSTNEGDIRGESEPAAGTDEGWAELAATFDEITSAPPLVSVVAEDAGRGRPVPSGFGQSAPGMLTMSLLMMTVIYGAVFLSAERSEGTLRRQASVPLTRAELMAGKLLGRMIIALAQAAILMLLGTLLFDVFWGHSLPGLLLTVVSLSACAASMGLFFGAIFRTADQAGALGWIAPLLLAALGGCWWPLEIVPRWLRWAGHISPAAWAMDSFHRLISFGEGVGAVWFPVAVLAGYATGLTWLAARKLRWE